MTTVTGSRRTAAGLGTLAVILFGAGTATATTIESAPTRAGQEPAVTSLVAGAVGASSPALETAAVAGPASSSAETPAITTEPATTTTSKATVTNANSTSTNPAAVPTTPVPPARQTAAVTPPSPATTRWARLSPDHGPTGTSTTASGGGCVGSGAGISIVTKEPLAGYVVRQGGRPLPDGTWSIPISTDPTTGDYQVIAACVTGAEMVAYQPLTFSVIATPDGESPPNGGDIARNG